MKLGLMKGLVATLCLAIGATAYGAMGDRHQVGKDQSVLRGDPSTESSAVQKLKAKELVIELERQGQWVLVAVKRSGNQGWLHRSALAPYKDKQPTTRTYTRTLVDLGYKKGVKFEGGTGMHAQDFNFPLPHDTQLAEVQLRLFYRPSPLLHEASNLRIDVNDTPVKVVNIPHDEGMHRIDLSLPLSAVGDDNNGVAKITVHGELMSADGRSTKGNLVHILEQTALLVSYKSPVKSIRDNWLSLPKQVTLSLPEGDVTEDIYTAAWRWMVQLHRAGHKVEIVRLPELGDISVAPASAIESVLTANYPKHFPAEFQLSAMADGEGSDSTVRLVDTPDGPLMAITEPYGSAILASNRWNLLAAGTAYHSFNMATPFNESPITLKASNNEQESGQFELPLNRIGIDTNQRRIAHEVEWNAMLTPWTMPPGTLPVRLGLDFVAPPQQEGRQYELYTYYNGILVQTAKLAGNGQEQHISVPLNPVHHRQYDHIRLVVINNSGDNYGENRPVSYPIQLSPTSMLVVEHSDKQPERFTELANYLSKGSDFYLPKAYLERPESTLQIAAKIASEFPLTQNETQLLFVDAKTALAPKRPFVAIGALNFDQYDTPVKFNQGRVRITDGQGDTLLDVDRLDNLAVIQIIETDANSGLWVRPSNDNIFTELGTLILNEDDVAFVDRKQVLLTLSSQQPTLAKVDYLDVDSWIDYLNMYRFWILAIAWLLLTAFVLYLYRMTKRHHDADAAAAKTEASPEAAPEADTTSAA